MAKITKPVQTPGGDILGIVGCDAIKTVTPGSHKLLPLQHLVGLHQQRQDVLLVPESRHCDDILIQLVWWRLSRRCLGLPSCCQSCVLRGKQSSFLCLVYQEAWAKAQGSILLESTYFPVQVNTSRIGSHTRLMPSVPRVMNDHTRYIVFTLLSGRQYLHMIMIASFTLLRGQIDYMMSTPG